ncbi:hypothetical protein VKI21_02320 [Cyanobacterium aponinum UTEX 3222]|uniref:hypothetical protein n=1 Tax=Cyanobacterium aponinum TaxID=379064 RepID=UPI003087D0E4|nr:hypothetical protein VKI21_02320 [Cyanobacterium aponinum UTEX 3222]
MFRDKYKTFNSILGVKIPPTFNLYSRTNGKNVPFAKYLVECSYSSKREAVGIVHTVCEVKDLLVYIPFFQDYSTTLTQMLELNFFQEQGLSYEVIPPKTGICPPKYTIHHITRIYGKSHNSLLNNEFLTNYFYCEYVGGLDYRQQRMENLMIFSKKDNINLDRYMDTQILT